MGKTTVIDAFLTSLANGPHVRMGVEGFLAALGCGARLAAPAS